MSDNGVKSVIIIGGGLVGPLCALYLAKLHHKVTVYEYRSDIRLSQRDVRGKSINLSLSNRGRRALREVGLEDLILKSAIPMRGRMIHNVQGQTKSIPYDSLSHQCIYSVARNYLNQVLLTAAESYPNIKIHFNHKLTASNLENGTVTLLNTITEEVITAGADLIIGADGAFSALRRIMQQTPLFEYSQTYIKHGYLELSIPAKNSSLMASNHLHIWPRNEFMMIALPNQDQSWTVTLFMSFEQFHSISDKIKLLDFFEKTFPDAINIIGKQALEEDFFATKPSPLVSIKCNPYDVGGRFLIIGDAAHAMVPFYGQGMNAGFEDCQLLYEVLKENRGNVQMALREFSLRRVDDAYAICDLAMYNYVEMRSLVNKRSFYLRKKLDEVLFKLFPSLWVPLYNSVTFSHMDYQKCVKNRNWQNKVIESAMWSMMLLSTGFTSYYAINYFNN